MPFVTLTCNCIEDVGSERLEDDGVGEERRTVVVNGQVIRGKKNVLVIDNRRVLIKTTVWATFYEIRL